MAYDQYWQAADAARRAGIERPAPYELEDGRWDYLRPAPCGYCDGTGTVVNVYGGQRFCGRCDGTGKEYVLND